MCGQSWHAIKDSLTHHPSSQGWAPGALPIYVQVLSVSYMYLDRGMCGGWYLLSFFLSFLFWLVCYKYTFHGFIEKGRYRRVVEWDALVCQISRKNIVLYCI